MLQKIVVTLLFFALSPLCIAGTITYDFGDENLANWEFGGQEGQWMVTDGELCNDFRGFPSSDLVTGSDEWDNYTIQCKAKVMETFPVGNDVTWAGIALRYQDTNNCYVFGIDINKQRANFDLEVSGKSKIWLSFPQAFEKNKYYRLKAVAEMDLLQFYIDDVLIHECKDMTYAFGKVGVLALHAHVQFDDFTISGEGIDKSFGLAGQTRPLTATWGRIKE